LELPNARVWRRSVNAKLRFKRKKSFPRASCDSRVMKRTRGTFSGECGKHPQRNHMAGKRTAEINCKRTQRTQRKKFLPCSLRSIAAIMILSRSDGWKLAETVEFKTVVRI
jgi:hypothetical protein